MKSSSLMAAPKEDALVTLLHAEVSCRGKKLQEALRRQALLQEAVAPLTERRQLMFRVQLDDLWQNEGGQSVKVEHRGSLGTAMEKAIAEYLRVNQRSDVQATYRVWIVLPKVREKDKEIDCGVIPIPEEYWENYKFKHGK